MKIPPLLLLKWMPTTSKLNKENQMRLNFSYKKKMWKKALKLSLKLRPNSVPRSQHWVLYPLTAFCNKSQPVLKRINCRFCSLKKLLCKLLPAVKKRRKRKPKMITISDRMLLRPPPKMVSLMPNKRWPKNLIMFKILLNTWRMLSNLSKKMIYVSEVSTVRILVRKNNRFKWKP